MHLTRVVPPGSVSTAWCQQGMGIMHRKGAKPPQQHAAQPRQTMHRLVRAAGSGQDEIVESLSSIPLFPLPSVLHPTQMGTLLVYEPRYLTLFRDLQASTPAGSEARFGHILASGRAPPALMQDSVGGLPSSGVCATIRSIEELENGRLQVSYQGWRRIKLLAVDDTVKPYPLAATTWLDDDTASLSREQVQLTDQLEQEVFGLLQQVAKYSHMLAAGGSQAAAEAAEAAAHGSKGGNALLPDSVLLYAPPPPAAKQQFVADYLIKAGGSTGDKIATWQRMGSVYGNTSAKKKPAQDPYQMARDRLGKERRQELFSFAAASVLDLGLPERLALLYSRDTAARLQFVAAAVQPFLADLLARVSVKQAIVKH